MKLSLLFLLALAASASAAPFDLGLTRNFPIGAGPSAVAVEDFDRDGNLDFAVTQRDIDSVSVWLGTGAGKFATPARYPTGDFPIAMAAADLNEDGRLDLAIVNSAANSVTVYLGAVFGTFSNRIDYPAGALPSAIAIGDLNGDTHPDVAITSFTGNSVRVLKGGFQTGINGSFFTVPTATGPRGIATGDFNRDGLLDLMTASVTADSISILTNSFNGFGAHYEVGVTGDPSAVVVGDMNNDGWPDAAVALSASGYVVTLKNVNGLLGYDQTFVAENNPDCVYLADVHGDDGADLVIGHSSSGLVTVLTGAGNGNFTIPQSVPAGGSGLLALGVGDFDGDGIRDIVAPSLAPATLSILYANRYDGQGPFGYSSFIVPGFGTADVAVADLNGDKHDDIAVTARQSGWIKTFMNDGNGGFPDTNEAYIFGQFGANALEATDFNGDLLPDLAITTALTGPSDTNRVRVFLNQGGGAFEPYTDYDVGVPVRVGLGVGDFTNDGKLDLVTTHQGSTVAQILSGDGLGAFSNGASLTTAGGVTTLDVADVNAGGLDLFFGGTDRVSAFLANGAGGFAPKVDYTLGSAVAGIAHADFDEDGKLDIAVANAGSTVSILRGDGLGGFTNTGAIPVPGVALLSMVAGDFNGDGDVDLLVGRNDPNAALLYGFGDGTFAAPVFAGFGNPITCMTTGLLDGNATRDIVPGNASSALSPRTTKGRTRLALAVTPNPTAVGQSITYKATVTAALPDSSKPVGTVYFYDGTTNLGSAAVSNGTATLVQPGNYPWERRISAHFKADVNGPFLGSLSRTVDHFTYVPTVGIDPPVPAPGALALAPLGNPVRSGGALRVRLEMAPGSAARLTLHDVRGRVLASRLVSEGGVAELSPSARLAAGVYLVKLEQDGKAATARAVVL